LYDIPDVLWSNNALHLSLDKDSNSSVLSTRQQVHDRVKIRGETTKKMSLSITQKDSHTFLYIFSKSSNTPLEMLTL
jgi:hypothetical protein